MSPLAWRTEVAETTCTQPSPEVHARKPALPTAVLDIVQTSSQPARTVWRPIARSPRWPLVLISLWCGALFFFGLTAGELWRTESLRAIIAEEMLRSGDWL